MKLDKFTIFYVVLPSIGLLKARKRKILVPDFFMFLFILFFGRERGNATSRQLAALQCVYISKSKVLNSKCCA